jgi:hypothetical protein
MLSRNAFPSLAVIALVSACTAGAVAFLMAYEQTSRSFVAKEARRRAYGAAVGPFVFFALLGILLAVVVPLLFHEESGPSP